MNRNRRRAGIVIAAVIAGLGETICAEMPEPVAVFRSPQLVFLTVGANAVSWNWTNGAPYVDAYYMDANQDSFFLEGNGHSIYQCWDEMGFAFINETPLTGDFQLTARFADLPEEGPGTVGLTLKANMQTHSPVLDLRWDYFYPEKLKNPNGLRWFNRWTPKERIGFCHSCETGLCQGSDCHSSCTSKPDDPGCWQGCLNMGFENFADPEEAFTQSEGIWVRVRREGLKFHLYATYDTSEWKQIEPISNMGTPLDHFRLPGLDTNNLVFAGFSVVGVERGGHIQSAIFDNITLEVYSYSGATGAKSSSIPRQSSPRLKLVGSTVIAPAGTKVRKAEIFGTSGRKTGMLVREGDRYTIADCGNLPAGVHWIRMQLPEGTISIPYVKH